MGAQLFHVFPSAVRLGGKFDSRAVAGKNHTQRLAPGAPDRPRATWEAAPQGEKLEIMEATVVGLSSHHEIEVKRLPPTGTLCQFLPKPWGQGPAIVVSPSMRPPEKGLPRKSHPSSGKDNSVGACARPARAAAYHFHPFAGGQPPMTILLELLRAAYKTGGSPGCGNRRYEQGDLLSMPLEFIDCDRETGHLRGVCA
jgi:hypothetical protein